MCGDPQCLVHRLPAFGEDQIDYDQVRVIKGRYLFFQGKNYAVAPNGKIYYPLDCGNFARCVDVGGDPGGNQYLFVHEMEHVRQYQQGVRVVWRALPLQFAKFATFGLYDPYAVLVGAPHYKMNVEQQADFVVAHLYPEYVKYKP